ncbi:MAG: FtsX-like permease family protein [Rhodothermales bacterium]
MLYHYIQTAIRSIRRHPGYAFINIAGLSVAVCVALLLLLFTRTELSYDRFHDNADRTYRVSVMEDWGPDQQFFNTTTPLRIGPTVLEQIPDVEAWVRYDRWRTRVISGDDLFDESLFMVDPSFHDVFDFEVLEGDPDTMFDEPTAVVLTETARERWLGTETALGATLQMDIGDGLREFTVTGVLANPPIESSLQFTGLLSYRLGEMILPPGRQDAWFNVGPETYAVLGEGVTAEQVESDMAAIITQNGVGAEQGIEYILGLQPITDIHLNPEYPVGHGRVSNPVYVQLMAALALLLLVVASINFVTLSIGRSLGRAREVGVRKAIGAGRGQLMRQYWGESLVHTGLALIFGIGLAELMSPAFEALSGQPVLLRADLSTVALALGVYAVIGLAAGLYPAILLSGMQPVRALRGSAGSVGATGRVRKTLVVAQFAFTILLLAGTSVVQRQLDFIQKADLGYEGDQVVYVSVDLPSGETFELAERIRTAAASDPGIQSVASSLITFGEAGWGRAGYTATDGSYRRFYVNIVDHAFVPTLGLRMAEGRNFSLDQPADFATGLLVNQAFVDAYGWVEPLQAQLPGNWPEHRILGVVEDFHYASLHSRIEPAVMAMSSDLLFAGIEDFDFPGAMRGNIVFRLDGADRREGMARLETLWARAAPDLPFNYQHLDANLEAQYEQEQRVARITGLGSLLAVLIAGLGLLGLAALAVARRTKEIGIRRVLGASAMGIVGLFTAEFSRLVTVAFLVAVPVTWWATDRWLETFAYRTTVGISPFLLAGAVAFGIMLAAVAARTGKAAMAPPVTSLRNE